MVPVAHGDTSAKEVWRERVTQGWWGDPGFRVSHGFAAMLTRNVQGSIRTWCKHMVHLIQHMHSVHVRRLGVTPSKRANGTVLVGCKVEEVAVLAM